MRTLDIAVSSKEKLTWREAKLRCEAAGLVLLVIESQGDNDFLNFHRRFKPPMAAPREFFWSGARFTSTDYRSLRWDPTKTEIPDFRNTNGKGITKVWESGEPLDDLGSGKDLCVDIRFPGAQVSPPVWQASDCSLRKNYICVRRVVDRARSNPQAAIQEQDDTPATPQQIKTPKKPTETLKDDFVDYSKAMGTWSEALAKCQKSNLTLLIIESQDDQMFLSQSTKLKTAPYSAESRFWSSARFAEVGDRYKLYWEPYHKEFPGFLADNANGIIKKWASPPLRDIDPNVDKTCVEMQFPSATQPPRWQVSECYEKKFYICTLPPKKRSDATPAHILDNSEDIPPPRLSNKDYSLSKGKQPWNVAQKVCKSAGLTLMAIESESDNQILHQANRLKTAPYSDESSFWSGGRFTSTEYTKLQWEPSKKEFPDFRENGANGIKKFWAKGEPADDSGSGKEVCVDIKFPRRGLPTWSASDCDERKYFICMKPTEDRINNPGSPTKPLKEPPQEVEKPVLPPHPLKDHDTDVSKSMLPWEEAKQKCEESRLILLTIECEADNTFLNFAKKLKKSPLSASTDFWSGGKFTSSAYTKLMWDPTKTEFPDFRSNNANGIKKWWATGEPNDDNGSGDETCVSMQFPGKSPPIWTASDCNERKYYICMRPNEQRDTAPNKPATIFDPDAEEEAKEPAEPIEGTFYPDQKSKKPITGTLHPGNPQLFTPKNPKEAVTRITPGTFKPKETNGEEQKYPFSTVHGLLRPSKKKGSSEFIPDKIVQGEFKPDTSGSPLPGSMTQDSPGVFTPDNPPYITKPTAGSWKPTSGILPNHPCKTVHGTMRPIPDSPSEAQFSPDPEIHGSFIPDDTNTPVHGTLTQTNPPEFTPYNPEEQVQEPTSGIWKPKPLKNPSSISHGVLQPNGDTATFIPDEEIPGQFIPNSDPSSPIEGTMTKNKPQLFTPTESTDFSSPIPGTWKPNKNKPPKGIPGVLRPDSNIPQDSALFEPGKSKSTTTKKPSQANKRPLSGSFFPDSNTKKPIHGTLNPGEPQLFHPDQPSEAVVRPTQGTFKPEVANTLEYPFGTIHGTMKPYPGAKDTSAFLPDTAVPGEFSEDKGCSIKPGTLSQDNPSKFTPDFPPYIENPTQGNWKPTAGILPNHPCNTIHGTMQPEGDPPTNSIFTPDPTRRGTFIPDKNPKKPVAGALTQSNPPKFTPDAPSLKFKEPTSGTWKPRPLYNPSSSSHGTMKPNPDGTSTFVPDDVTSGKFIPDKDQTSPLEGYMTTGTPQIFTPNDETDFSKPMLGTWKPHDSPSKGTHGTLKPWSNLPRNHALFEPGAGVDSKKNTPGKFCRDDRPKTPISGFLTKDSPYKFTPQNPATDLSGTPKGVWTPDKSPDPNDPFSSMRGVMDEGSDGPVFIPDVSIDGMFIPDSASNPIEGTMNMETNPKLFTPTDDTTTIRPTLGTWRPTFGSPIYPYSTIRGIMRPSATDPGSGHFTPDLTVEGEFVPKGKAPIPGYMNQGNPAIFSPNEPFIVKGPTPGVWRPLMGATPIYPFVIIPGYLKPTPDGSGGEDYIFVPLDKVKGVFIPDAPNAKPIKGQATQSNPSKFLPDGPSNVVKRPTSGTWKPVEEFIPDDPKFYSHCVLAPSPDKQIFFIPDEVTPGKFVPDGEPKNAIHGQLTKPQGGNRPVFKPDNGEPITSTMTGTFIPDPVQNNEAEEPTKGTLTPSTTKTLPDNHAYLSPTPVAANNAPNAEPQPEPDNENYPSDDIDDENVAVFAPDESSHDDCDPTLQNVDPDSRFYVSCGSARAKK